MASRRDLKVLRAARLVVLGLWLCQTTSSASRLFGCKLVRTFGLGGTVEESKLNFQGGAGRRVALGLGTVCEAGRGSRHPTNPIKPYDETVCRACKVIHGRLARSG